MSYFGWRPYVPVAERRRRAQKDWPSSRRAGQDPTPVKIEGRTIASSFWGKSWCENLERYSDYASRLPRGRSYVRNGSVVDLRIDKGKIAAKVAGSELYNVEDRGRAGEGAAWKAICRDCAGSIDSLVELLQGRLAKGVMERVCRKGDGLFPAPRRSSCRAVARIGRTCASTWRRSSTASARGSTKSPSCCSCCAMSTKRSCWPAPGGTSRSPRRRPGQSAGRRRRGCAVRAGNGGTPRCRKAEGDRSRPPEAAAGERADGQAGGRQENREQGNCKQESRKQEARKRENRQPERGKERRTGRSGRCHSRRSVGAPCRVNRGFLNLAGAPWLLGLLPGAATARSLRSVRCRPDSTIGEMLFCSASESKAVSRNRHDPVRASGKHRVRHWALTRQKNLGRIPRFCGSCGPRPLPLTPAMA